MKSLRVIPVCAPTMNDTAVDTLAWSGEARGSFSEVGRGVLERWLPQAMENGWLSQELTPQNRKYACVPGLMSMYFGSVSVTRVTSPDMGSHIAYVKPLPDQFA